MYKAGFLKAMKRKASEEELFCEVCNKKFPYRSKYERHIVSQNHQRFARSLALADEVVREHPNGLSSSLCFSPSNIASCVEPDGDSDIEEAIPISVPSITY